MRKFKPLDQAEHRLVALSLLLDVPLAGHTAAEGVSLGIVRQAVDLYLGILRELRSKGLVSAIVMTRSLTDAMILVRWMELDPDLHLRMYLAEDDRSRIAVAEAAGAFIQVANLASGGSVFSAEEVARMRLEIRTVRAEAVARGQRISDDTGSVLPSVEAMSVATADPVVDQAYKMVYRVLSPWTHFAGRSLVGHSIEERDTGKYLAMGSLWESWHIRLIAAMITGLLIEAGDRAARAGISAECAAVQQALAEWTALNL